MESVCIQLTLAEHNGLLRLSRSKAANHRCLGCLWTLCSLDQFSSSWLRLLRTQLIEAALNESETPSLISDETIILEPGGGYKGTKALPKSQSAAFVFTHKRQGPAEGAEMPWVWSTAWKGSLGHSVSFSTMGYFLTRTVKERAWGTTEARCCFTNKILPLKNGVGHVTRNCIPLLQSRQKSQASRRTGKGRVYLQHAKADTGYFPKQRLLGQQNWLSVELRPPSSYRVDSGSWGRKWNQENHCHFQHLDTALNLVSLSHDFMHDSA
ncbi:uncharacterized protein LOC131830815 isoform X1 [Mustela lutreola]|uniref:uncharacterized protein LOC131830815 isoform X1 n=2 Tax=Mustela lutreola TaxID=9666 RepID=UPI00279738C5|nr:uncharacterized protein LOC131830815 isoform X1 [Mustela lutreola]